MDNVIKEDVFDIELRPIDQLDAGEVALSNLTKQEKALVETLSASHPAKQIRIHQTDPLHATYIDKSDSMEILLSHESVKQVWDARDRASLRALEHVGVTGPSAKEAESWA